MDSGPAGGGRAGLSGTHGRGGGEGRKDPARDDNQGYRWGQVWWTEGMGARHMPGSMSSTSMLKSSSSGAGAALGTMQPIWGGGVSPAGLGLGVLSSRLLSQKKPQHARGEK